MVSLASNFIVGDKMIPLDAEKRTETPLMEGVRLLCQSLVIAIGGHAKMSTTSSLLNIVKYR